MAIRTQIRLPQITGSLGIGAGQIRPDDEAGALSGKTFTNLSGSLSAMLSGISRIHGRTGDNALNNVAGTFYGTLKSDSTGNVDIGSTTDADKFGDIFVGDGKGLQIGAAEEHKIIDGAPGLLIDTSEVLELNSSGGAISIGNDAVAQAINVGTGAAARTITVGNDASAEVEVNALIVDLNAASTDANALTIDSAGGIDITASGDHLDIAGSSTAGKFINITAPGAGATQLVLTSAGANAQAVNINATGTDGGVDIDAAGAIGINSAGGVITISGSNGATSVNVTSPATFADNVVITGNLDINGTTTTIDSTNLTIEDRIIGLGVSGSNGDISNLETGIIFNYGTAGEDKQTGFYFDGERFKMAKTATSAASGSFAAISQGDHSILQLGKVEISGTDESISITDGGNSLTAASSNIITLDAVNAVKIDSDSGDISFEDGGTAQLAIDMDGTAGEIIMQLKVDSDDLVFKQYDGTEVLRLTDGGDVEIKDDLTLKSDAGVLGFGADASPDTTLTHVTDTGLLLNSTRQIQFGDSATHIKQVSDSNLEIEADGSVILDSPVVLLEDNAVALKLGSAQQFVLTHANDNTGATITSTHRLNFGAPSRTISDDGTGITMEGQYIAVGNRNVGPGKIRFQENTGQGAHFAEIQGRDLAASYGLVLPAVGGTAGQFLQVLSLDGVNRQLTFADVGAGASSKIITNVTASVPAGEQYSGAAASFDLSAVSQANAINAVDVFVNGQLLQSSSVAYGALAETSAGDYAVNTDAMSASHVKFTFDIESDDTVSVIVRA